MDEQRERWKVFEAEKHLQQMNHILKTQGWRLEVLYDQTGTALDAYPVRDHGHKPTHKDTMAE
jgi:hypothetical protein